MKKDIVLILAVIFCVLNSYCSYSQVRKVYSSIETKNILYFKIEEIVKMTFGGTTTRYTVSDLSLISKVKLGPDNIRIITPIYKDKSYRVKYYIETENSEKGLGKKQEPTLVTEITIENKKIETSGDSKVDKISLALAISNLTKTEPVLVIKNKPKNSQGVISSNQIPKILKTEKKSLPQLIPDFKNVESTSVFAKSKPQKKQDGTNFIETLENSKADKTQTTSLGSNLKKAESSPLSKTELAKEKQNYVSINVTDVYERVAQKGYKSEFMFKEMANSYYFKDQMDKAAKWYAELFAMAKDLEPMYYYRYGVALIKSGNTEKGNAMIEKFNKLVE